MIGTPGGSPDRNARLMVKHFGLEPEKDLKFSPGGLPEGRLARLQQGLIDATVVPLIFLQRRWGLMFSHGHMSFSPTPGAD